MPLSAAEVLRRADARLAELVTPGSTFYRRWESVLTVQPLTGPALVIPRVCEEWAEGSVPNRLAARTETPDGRLVETAWTIPENAERRLFYYNAGEHQLGDPTGQGEGLNSGAVFRWPTRAEIAAEALRFPFDRRASLQFAFDFALMEPVVMEHRFPKAAEHFATTFTSDRTTYGDQKPGIRLTLAIPKAAVFDLGGRRFSVSVGEWRGTYVYDGESYLLQSFDGDWNGRDGVRAHYRLRLNQCRLIPASAEVFEFVAPVGTKEVSLSTADVLGEIDRALFGNVSAR